IYNPRVTPLTHQFNSADSPIHDIAGAPGHGDGGPLRHRRVRVAEHGAVGVAHGVVEARSSLHSNGYTVHGQADTAQPLRRFGDQVRKGVDRYAGPSDLTLVASRAPGEIAVITHMIILEPLVRIVMLEDKFCCGTVGSDIGIPVLSGKRLAS